MASVATSVALCKGSKHNGQDCVNPNDGIPDGIVLNMTDVDNLVKYKAVDATDDKINNNILKNLGLCPKGMVEVKDNGNDYITCLPYINEAQKVLCDDDKGYVKYDNDQNILIDNTADNDSQYTNNGFIGKRRYGCTIGNKMKYNETSKLFNCVENTSSTGGSTNKECRIGYGLQPVQVPAGHKVNGVCTSGLGTNCVAGIVFKCKKLREGSSSSYLPLLSCNDALTNPSNAGASNISINICSSADADVTNKFSAADSIKDDITSSQCIIDTASKSFKDEFEKTINYNRATMMFIIGDCKICM